MKHLMKRTAAISLLLTAFCVGLYRHAPSGFLLSLTITSGTMAYHFAMRLAMGTFYDQLLRNRVDYTRPWFQVGGREMAFYQVLRVRRWKNKVPTYDTDAFDPAIHSWDEIAQAMCQSELVHETNALLSFLPLILPFWFGSFWVFFITSFLSAGFDLMFVAIQRFNRPRVLRLVSRKRT